MSLTEYDQYGIPRPKNSFLDGGGSFLDAGAELSSVASSGGPQLKNTLAAQPNLSDLDKPKTLTAGQQLGLGALSTGLKTAGSIMNTRANEKFEMEQLANEYDLQLDQIEYQSWMSETLQDVSSLRKTLSSLQNLGRQNRSTGGRQTQQFFRDPRTGASI